MRFGRQTFVSEPRLYNPGDEFRTKEYGNRESFLIPASDGIWADPVTGEKPESVPGVMRLRPRGYQDAVNREVTPPAKIRVAHKAEEVLAWLIGDDGQSGQIGGQPRFVRELSPSDAINAEYDATVIEKARQEYLVGRVRTAEAAVARHEAQNSERAARGISKIPPSGLTKREYEFLATLKKDAGVQCPKCGENFRDLSAAKGHIDAIHPADTEALYSQAGIKVEAAKRKYTKKSKAEAAA
jgi:hypothetical protein